MKNIKNFIAILILFTLIISNFNVLAFEDVDISFDLGVDGWTSTTNYGSIGVETLDQKSCLVIDSPNKVDVYEKLLNEKILADGNVYVLSYDIKIPKIPSSSSGKQTFVIEGHSKNGVNSFYGLRIDNGVISYFNGNDQYGRTDALKDGKTGQNFTITENEWHNLKSVYNRTTATFTFYVDDVPLVNENGSLVCVSTYQPAKSLEIEKLVLRSKSVGEDKIYVDNISVYKSDMDYDVFYENFNNNTNGFSLKKNSGTGTISVEETVDGHNNCAYIVSSGDTTYYQKELNQYIEASDKGVYELSYDMYLTSVDNLSPKHTTSVICLGSNGVNSFYGLRIDNGQVAYYNGKGQYDVSYAYDKENVFTLSANKWYKVKSIYDRSEGTFSYFINDKPLLTKKGDKVKVDIRTSELENKIRYLALLTKTSGSERTYFDNICVKKIDKIPDEKYVNIYNVEVKDSDLNSIDFANISNKTALKIDFDYDATKNFVCAMALYKNNSLLDVVLKKVDVSKDGFMSKLSFDIENDKNANEIKFFGWNNMQNITPYDFTKRSEKSKSISVSLNSLSIDNNDFKVSADNLNTVNKSGNNVILLKAPVMGNNDTEIQNKKYNSELGGPVESYYIDFCVKDKSFLNKRNGVVYEIDVEYFDEGYGCFVLEYNTLRESFKESEYVELNNTLTWKKHTFVLENAYFTGDKTDFRLSTWGDIMRYSNFDVAFKSVTLKNKEVKNQFIIKNSTNRLGNIVYTGEDITFTTKISNRPFYEYSNSLGTYNATLKYTLVDENKNYVKNISEKTIKVTPISEISDSVTFSIDNYGLYYLKTEIESEENLIHSQKFTELSYVKSDKTTVNSDFGISMQPTIYEVAGSEALAKNAGIGMLRWVRSMGDVMSISYNDQGYTLKEKGWSSSWNNYQSKADSQGYEILNNLLAKNMIYSNKTYKGYKLRVPYGDEGRDLFSQYCSYFAENAPENTKYYEIWNEFDSGLGSDFNTNYESWEKYGDLLVKATDAIYDKDKDAAIVGMAARFVNTHQRSIDRVKELLNSSNSSKTLKDYFKKVSIHPYHWSYNPMNFTSDEFTDEERTMHINNLYEHMEELKNIYRTNGLDDTKLWISEIAWSAHYTSDYKSKPITEKQQGSYLVQSYIMSKKNNITEKFLSYLFARQTSVRVDRDKNMGILKNYKASETEVPLAATSAYLAVSNMNMLMANASYVDDFFFDNEETIAAYHFKRSNNKDLAVLWSIYENGKEVSINLGCNSIVVYDEYGNATNLTSTNGIYKFNLTQSTIYVEGQFTQFKKA